MATGAAAVVARARRNVQHYFFSRDAVRPDSAIPFQTDRFVDRRVFERMRRRGIVREAKPGQYWINVVAYDEDQRRRLTILKFIVLALALALFITGLIAGLAR